MKVTILGSGTSTGIPEYRCDCDTCSDARRPGSPNRRTRPSIHVEVEGRQLQFDTGPNFLDQIDRCRIPRIDAVLYTHCHADHTSGTNDLVMPCRKQEADIAVFGPAQAIAVLQRNFDYLFTRQAYEGGGIAHLTPHVMEGTFDVNGIEVTAIPVEHAAVATVGYRVGPLAYVPDAKVIPAESLRKLKGVDLLIIDALSFNSRHPSHLSVSEALEVVAEVAPRQARFTHMMHRIDHHRFGEQCAENGIALPESARLSHDGLELEL